MRSGGCVLVTAISAILSGLRPARRAAAAMRSWIDAMFAAMDIGKVNHESPSLREGRGRGRPRHTVFTSLLSVELVHSDRLRWTAGGRSSRGPAEPSQRFRSDREDVQRSALS